MTIVVSLRTVGDAGPYSDDWKRNGTQAVPYAQGGQGRMEVGRANAVRPYEV